MSKELTPNTDGTIFEFLCGSHSYNGLWFGERPKGEGAFWWRKVLKDEIRKKEREAASKAWNESAATMSIESYVNEDDCVGFYDIQIEQAKQKFLNENYPL